MTIFTRADLRHPPEIFVGSRDHRRLVSAALTDVSSEADPTDFLLHELDRATIMADELLPSDIIRLNTIVRYKTGGGEERTVKLVLPEEISWNTGYRLSVTSMHGAALLGLRPGQILTWLRPDGVHDRVEIMRVANSFRGQGR